MPSLHRVDLETGAETTGTWRGRRWSGDTATWGWCGGGRGPRPSSPSEARLWRRPGQNTASSGQTRTRWGFGSIEWQLEIEFLGINCTDKMINSKYLLQYPYYLLRLYQCKEMHWAELHFARSESNLLTLQGDAGNIRKWETWQGTWRSWQLGGSHLRGNNTRT